MRKTLFCSQKKEFLELSNYTKHKTLAILTYFWKQFLLALTCKEANIRGHWSATLLTIIPLYAICICSKIWFLYTIIKDICCYLRFRIFMVVWNEKQEEIFIKLRNENKRARPWNDYFATVGHPVLSHPGATQVALIPYWT